MYYLNYYSRIRNQIQGDITAEIQRNNGKIITKLIEESNWSAWDKIRLRSKAYNIRRRAHIWLSSHPDKTDWYTEFRIPKRNGGYRVLHAPVNELKQLQKDILTFLVDDCKLLCHNAVHSFVKHRNCKTALEQHQKSGAHWFVKIDIKNFFTNCTRLELEHRLMSIHPLCLLDSVVIKNIVEVCTLNDSLPQGAPTSPLLSNLYLLQFDYQLSHTLRHYTYTRYADDILISKTTAFRYTDVVQTVNTLLPVGLVIKQDKLRYGSCNGSNWNLGLMYNKAREITVGYRNKHLIKNRIHNLFTHVPPDGTPEFVVWFQSLCELKGTLAYYLFIEPEYFTNLIERYKVKGYDL